MHNFIFILPQKDVMEQFEIPVQFLKEVERLLSAEFTKGLEREGEDVKVKMLVTHIHEMPKGTEEGEFLVVDLGINHLRVVHVSESTFSGCCNNNIFGIFCEVLEGFKFLWTGDFFNTVAFNNYRIRLIRRHGCY